MGEVSVESILLENERRRAEIYAPFNPITGEGSVGERVAFTISDFPIETQWLPVEMMDEPFVRSLQEAGSVERLIGDVLKLEVTDEACDKVVEEFTRIRFRYDFAFWAATLVYIKRKGGGSDVLFRLMRPQRKLVMRLERMRKAGMPIRLVLLKARQWGGSTCIQIYMAWLQLIHEFGLNSVIIAHVGSASDEIKDIFDRMIKAYPVSMLHELGEAYSLNERKLVGVGRSGNIFRVPQRNCKIKIGTAENPESCRSGDYNLVHLSEVGLWKETQGKKPEDIVDAATSGVSPDPNTMIVYESTAKGVGNFFHKEYLAAKNGDSQMEALFVAWYEIEKYQLEFGGREVGEVGDVGSVGAVSGVGRCKIDRDNSDKGEDDERYEFAKRLLENRYSDEVRSDREQPGAYLWRLWEKGATLEALKWYVWERAKYNSHGRMASEYPSDDIEAFTFSGRRVFDNEDVEKFRGGCRPPRWRGEIYGRADEGEKALEGLRFKKEKDGRLYMWNDVEKDDKVKVTDRYLVIVDVCKGQTAKADFADILVLDRLPMVDGEAPVVAAEWHGHIEMDKLAWKAAQVAAYYDNALLVIESNTLETNNTKGEAEYILTLIADVYDNLYTRKQSAEDIREGRPKKYGFHTNTLTKKVVIYNLKFVIRERLYVEREAEALDEYLVYIETDKGGYEAMEGYHDDRLMTRAIGMQVCYNEMKMPRIVTIDEKRGGGMNKGAVSAATI